MLVLLLPAGRALAQADAAAGGRDGGADVASDGGGTSAGRRGRRRGGRGRRRDGGVRGRGRDSGEPRTRARRAEGHRAGAGRAPPAEGRHRLRRRRAGRRDRPARRFHHAGRAGRHRLQIAASGHQPADVPVDLSPDGWTGIIRLSPGGPVNETVVATKPSLAAVRIEGEEARSAAGTGGDPFRVIESLPGVSQIIWPFSLYAIRGANPGTPASSSTGCACRRCFTSRSVRRSCTRT